MQLYGTDGVIDLLPGLIYSELKHDLSCSETAIGVIMELLEQHGQMACYQLDAY